MEMQAVASCLQMSLVDVHRMVVELGAGGILWETVERYLSVNPPTLRYALVRDVFFQDGLSLSIQPIIERSPDLDQTAQTLVGAYAQGAKIPNSLLLNILEQVNSPVVWEMYAWQGPSEATLVLSKHPELLVILARPMLNHVPDLEIHLLFQASVGDNRQLHATPEHPLRIIEDWIKSALPGSKEALARRDILLNKCIEWIVQGRDANSRISNDSVCIQSNLSRYGNRSWLRE